MTKIRITPTGYRVDYVDENGKNRRAMKCSLNEARNFAREINKRNKTKTKQLQA